MTGQGMLHGVRVLDLTRVIMGPLATSILADLGADVIMVEPVTGDTNRLMGPGPHPQLSGMSLNLLRNKRSVAVDLTTAEGSALVKRLASTCDVVVTTMRPRALAKLGVTYDDIVALRPDVVYCQAQGWPLDGERGDQPAYDDIVQTASGVADVLGRVTGEPGLVPSIIADKIVGQVIAQAVTAALLHRERTGEGQHIEVPMTSVMTAFILVEHGAGAISVPPVDEPGYRRLLTPDRRPHPTSDGWIHILPYTPAQFAAVFDSAGRADLADERLSDLPSIIASSSSLYRDIRSITPLRTTEQWVSFCCANDIPFSPVVTLEQLIAQLPVARHPDAGDYHVIPYPVRFSGYTPEVRRHSPLIGQDEADVVAELDALDAHAPRRT